MNFSEAKFYENYLTSDFHKTMIRSLFSFQEHKSVKYQGGTISTTKLLLRKVSNYYILKAKAPTDKPFADI